ncbi:hypothetical protein [Streptomyces regalis]|nr:hypothetical protein [Streptomyces regalis]
MKKYGVGTSGTATKTIARYDWRDPAGAWRAAHEDCRNQGLRAYWAA